MQMDIKEKAKKEISQLIEKYETEKSAGKILQYTEADTKNGFIEPLFQALGWDTQNRNEVSLETSISGGRVDYSFKIADVVKFFVEAKPLKADLDKPEYIEQTINYAWHKNVVWTILTDFESIKVFNAERKAKTTADSKFFEILYNEYITKFDQLWLLSKESIINGNLNKEAEKWGKKLKKQPVSKQILDDLLIAREKLTKNINSHSKLNKVTEQELDESVQRILDRLIFIRTCEDRNIEQNHLITAVRNQRGKGTWEELKNIFTKFDEAYNSKLFEKHLCEQLTIDDEVIAEIIELLYHTKDETIHYDFSMINADVLGNIYEQYLGHILKKTTHTAKLKETHQHRKEQGIYYTPNYIVDYIVKNTLGEILKTAKPKNVAKLRILDPACGSGSFLIRAYGELVNYYHKNVPGELEYFRKIEILKNNIYGVDLDKQAVEITQMNLLLKTLHHKERLPTLKNIKCGNSLIDDPAIAGDKAFNWNDEFKEVFSNGCCESSHSDVIARRSRGNLIEESQGGFDVVIGNPPYVDVRKMEDEEKKFAFKNYQTADNRINTFGLFIERGISLLNKNGFLGFIIPNTFLTHSSYAELRKMILEKCKIRIIVNFQIKVFKEATVETIIIILQRENKLNERKNNEMVIATDTIGIKSQKILQNSFNDIHSNAFMINFDKGKMLLLKNIERKTVPLIHIADAHNGINPGNATDEFVIDKKLNDSYKKVIDGANIKRYNIIPSGLYILYDRKKLERPRDEQIFLKRPKIIMQKIGKGLVAALDFEQWYSLINTTVIILKDKSYGIEFLLGLLNSKLLNFYYKGKYLGVQIKGEYLKQLPIHKIDFSKPDEKKMHDDLVKLVDKMLKLNKQLQALGNKLTDERKKIESEIQKTDKEIDDLVYKIYGLTKDEIKIVEGENKY